MNFHKVTLTGEHKRKLVGEWTMELVPYRGQPGDSVLITNGCKSGQRGWIVDVYDDEDFPTGFPGVGVVFGYGPVEYYGFDEVIICPRPAVITTDYLDGRATSVVVPGEFYRSV